MRALLQRVARALVRVDGEVVGEIDSGLLVLLGVLQGDGEEDARWIADRIAGYRVFSDGQGKMNLNLSQVGGSCLVVSQFTLAADGRRGRRPSFDRAAAPDLAESLYERVQAELRELGIPVESGRFGAAMEVELVNQGPATFLLESPTADQ